MVSYFFAATLVLVVAQALNIPSLPNGCVYPQCAAPPFFCRWQMGTDSNGCVTCGQLICDDNPLMLDEKPVACNKRGCANDCLNGYLLDSNGCPTCECKPGDCPKPECHMWMKCGSGLCPCECSCQPYCKGQQ